MITTELFSNHIELTILGELTIADYKEFEELSNYSIRFNGPLNVLLDMQNMGHMTIDAALEDLRYVKAHKQDFRRVAILSDSQWIKWGALLSQFFTEADMLVFEDKNTALAWLNETGEENAEETTP